MATIDVHGIGMLLEKIQPGWGRLNEEGVIHSEEGVIHQNLASNSPREKTM